MICRVIMTETTQTTTLLDCLHNMQENQKNGKKVFWVKLRIRQKINF